MTSVHAAAQEFRAPLRLNAFRALTAIV